MNNNELPLIFTLELTTEEWVELLSWAGENCMEPHSAVSMIVKEFLRDLRDTARMVEELDAPS